MTTRFTRAIATLTGAALLAVSTAAAAAPAPNAAASLSVARSPAVRAATPTNGKSKLGAAVPTATLISIGILGALTAVVLLVVADDNSDSN